MESVEDPIVSIAKSTAEINRINLKRAVNAGEDAMIVAQAQEDDFNEFVKSFSDEEAEVLR
ncbi:hypothetical protein [Pseudomonas ovata]|uniref:hypothetical protein n=1 Tax=Pseudomonas ovata TaxID=1839709 RepID=UPI001260309F|nr:hypothetical protein [Pseudomonas ovata]